MTSVSQHHKPRILSWRCTTTAFLFLAINTIFISAVAAAVAEPDRMIADSVLVFPKSTTTVPAALAAETLLRDDRMPVKVNGQWMFLSQDEMVELRKRNDIGTAVTTAPGTAGETKGDATAVTPTTKTTRTASSSPLPSFFDSSLASNFSNDSACPAFINSFLTNPTFKQCYPFSLLLQGSRSFFQAEKSLVSITQVLDATCAANATFCTSYLNRLATNLTDAANCGADYKLGNSIVVQAYDGMIGYQPLYAASCLTDPDTGAYCFANAITNLTTTANVYFYYLPLNSSLPTSGSEPSCNWCLKQTMAVYRSAAADRKKPIASTYLSAAQQVDTICGPAFVNDTLPAAIVSNTASLAKGPSLHWLAPALLFSVVAYLI